MEDKNIGKAPEETLPEEALETAAGGAYDRDYKTPAEMQMEADALRLAKLRGEHPRKVLKELKGG